MHAAPIPLAWRGLHARAREAAAAALDAAHLSGSDSSLVYAHTVQCFTHTQAGEANLAVRAGEAAVEGGRRLSPGIFVALPHVNLGAALLEAGESERALAQLAEGEARGAREHYVGRCWWELWTARAHLAPRRRRPGARVAGPGVGDRRGDGPDRPARRRDARRGGAGEVGVRCALEAAELLQQGGRVSDAARARMAAGGIPELQRARAAFVECGAPRLADRAASELRRLGLRVARSGAQRRHAERARAGDRGAGRQRADEPPDRRASCISPRARSRTTSRASIGSSGSPRGPRWRP